jgi:hypothetical protein
MWPPLPCGANEEKIEILETSLRKRVGESKKIAKIHMCCFCYITLIHRVFLNSLLQKRENVIKIEQSFAMREKVFNSLSLFTLACVGTVFANLKLPNTSRSMLA